MMKKKLYRNPYERMVGGVIAGLADYFRIDASILRIAFILLAGFSFPLIAAYLIAWLILEPTPYTEELKMEFGRNPRRRLYRNPASGYLGGVVAGMADYTGWSAGWLRLAWIICAFPAVFLSVHWSFFAWLGANTIPAYIILWIILPRQKLEPWVQEAVVVEENKTPKWFKWLLILVLIGTVVGGIYWFIYTILHSTFELIQTTTTTVV